MAAATSAVLAVEEPGRVRFQSSPFGFGNGNRLVLQQDMRAVGLLRRLVKPCHFTSNNRLLSEELTPSCSGHHLCQFSFRQV